MSKRNKKASRAGRQSERVIDAPDPEDEDDEPAKSGVAMVPVSAVTQVANLRSEYATIRPSKLEELIAKHAAENKVKPESIDRFRFIREHGLPNPTRSYNVIGIHRGSQTKDPVAIEHAVDESDAVAQAIKRLGIAQPHRWTFRCIIVEQ